MVLHTTNAKKAEQEVLEDIKAKDRDTMPPPSKNGMKKKAPSSSTKTTAENDPSSRVVIQGLVMIILFLSSALFYYIGGMNAEKVEVTNTEVIEIKATPVVHNDQANVRCQQICSMRRQIRYQKFSGSSGSSSSSSSHHAHGQRDLGGGYDILDVKQLKKSFQRSKVAMIQKLKQENEYGDYFAKIFLETTGEEDRRRRVEEEEEVNQSSRSGGNTVRGRTRMLLEDDDNVGTAEGGEAGMASSGTDSGASATPTAATHEEDRAFDDDDVIYNRSILPAIANSSVYENFKRKMLIKILETQSNIRREESNYMNCDCINGDKPINNGDGAVVDGGDIPLAVYEASLDNGNANMKVTHTFKESYIDIASYFSKFVWVNGGHSASAGHGNFHNETYTATLQKTIQYVFQSIGIEFEARNYAMGGTR